MSSEPDLYSGAGEPVARPAAAAPGRSSAQIRADIERQRQELSHSVEALRGRVTELTDWRRQVREHSREIVIGAAVVGFAVAAIAGKLAYNAVQKGAPPTPDLAIEEGKRIKQTLEAGTTPAAREPTPTPPAAQEPRS